MATYYVHAKTKDKDLFVLFLVSLRTSLVAHMVKDQPANTGDRGSIPGSGRSTGEENGNPLQYSFLENPTERGAWQATVHGVAKSQTRLSTHTQAK